MKNLQVQLYLKNKSLESLTEELAIKARRHIDYKNLVQLTYNQIESPKLNPIVKECRGLILDEDNDWNIVALPYFRFFNYGEGGSDVIDWNTARVEEKMDGSLIIFYFYANEWNVATKGNPAALGQVHDYGYTFESLFWEVWESVGYQENLLDPDYTYLFELCTPYNKVIVPHEYNMLYLHGIRSIHTLEYISTDSQKQFPTPKIYSLNNFDEIIDSFKYIDGTSSEGYIVTDGFDHRVKVKNPQYLALSHMKEGLTERRIVEIIRTNESEEFLTYFSEYRGIYNKYKHKYDLLVDSIKNSYQLYKDIENQKDYALAIKDLPYKGILFSMRKSGSVYEHLSKITIDSLIKLME